MLWREGLFKHRVERLGEPLTRGKPLRRRVLETIRHPDVGYARRAQGLAHRGPDLPRPPAVLDPEFPDALVGMRERKAIGGFGVGEAGGIEVEPHAAALRPADPVDEVRGVDLVAVHLLAAKLAIEGVEVEPVLAWDDRERGVEIAAEFVGRAGSSGIVAGHGEAAADRPALVLEAADVVSLPAVQRHGNLGEGGADLVGVHAERLITLAGVLVGGFDLLGGRHVAIVSRS